jgi:MoaA/NifB/PqqE/SkfB family radical SAM enzyme
VPDARALPSIEYGEFSRRLHEGYAERDRVIKAQLEVTYRCNLRCAHCYTDPYNDPKLARRELTLDEIRRIVDEMVALGIVYLNLTGGEIFARPDFFEIYDHAYRQGLLLMLYTNGTMLTPAIIDRLEQSPPFSVDISCHSVNEAAFDRFTGVPGSFRRFMDAMERLRRSRLPFAFKTKAMTWNRDEIPDVRRFVESFGRSFGFTTSLSPRLDGDLAPLRLRLTPAQIRALEAGAPGANAAGESYRETAEALASSAPETLYRCGCATSTIHISAWGELGTCTLQYEHRVSLREHSLKDAIARVFAAVRARRYTSDSPCRTCAIYAFCDKKPTDARWECDDPEAPIAYDCDVALARAERGLGRAVPHPLRGRAAPAGHLRPKGDRVS